MRCRCDRLRSQGNTASNPNGNGSPNGTYAGATCDVRICCCPMKSALQHFAEHRQNHPTLTSHVDENRIERAIFEGHHGTAWSSLGRNCTNRERNQCSRSESKPQGCTPAGMLAQVSTRPKRLRMKGAIISAVLDHAWIMGWRGIYPICSN